MSRREIEDPQSAQWALVSVIIGRVVSGEDSRRAETVTPSMSPCGCWQVTDTLACWHSIRVQRDRSSIQRTQRITERRQKGFESSSPPTRRFGASSGSPLLSSFNAIVGSRGCHPAFFAKSSRRFSASQFLPCQVYQIREVGREVKAQKNTSRDYTKR